MSVGPWQCPASARAALPHLDDELSEGLRDDLQQPGGVLAAVDVEGGHHEPRGMVQVPSGDLQGQQDQN